MGDLLVLLYEVQALWQNRIVLVFVFADLHKDLDHVLYTVTDGSFVENCTKTFKDGCICFGSIFGEKCANFTREPNGNLNGVVGRAFEQQDKYLKCDNLMCDGLVDEVCNEGGG